MSKHIYIINGSGGKGKDTFVEFCSHFTSVFNISSVDKVKEAARIMGWSGGKTEKDRKYLATLKFLSTEYNDNPYNHIKENIEHFNQSENYKVMFIHIREPEEIDRVKKDFNCKTVLIKNINVNDITSNEADANVYNYNYDYVICNNDSLELLRQQAYVFIMSLYLTEDK